MTPKIRNIIIFAGIGAAFVLIYIFFLKPAPEAPALISSSGTPAVTGSAASGVSTPVTDDFLALLLSVKSIKLDDSIFSDPAFSSLHDSSIVLVPDVNEGGGRINPFAPLGSDAPLPPVTTPNTTLPPPSTTAPISPAPGATAPISPAPGAVPGATKPVVKPGITPPAVNPPVTP